MTPTEMDVSPMKTTYPTRLILFQLCCLLILTLFTLPAEASPASASPDRHPLTLALEVDHCLQLGGISRNLHTAFEESGFGGTNPPSSPFLPPLSMHYPVEHSTPRTLGFTLHLELRPRVSFALLGSKSPIYEVKGIGHEMEDIRATQGTLVGMFGMNPLPEERYKPYQWETYLLIGPGLTSARVTKRLAQDAALENEQTFLQPHVMIGGEGRLHLGKRVSLVLRGAFLVSKDLEVSGFTYGSKELQPHQLNLSSMHLHAGLQVRFWSFGS